MAKTNQAPAEPTRLVSTAAVICRLEAHFADDGSQYFAVTPEPLVAARVEKTPPYYFAWLLIGEQQTINRAPTFGAWFLSMGPDYVGKNKDGYKTHRFAIYECGFRWSQLESFAREHGALEADERLTDPFRGVPIRTRRSRDPNKRAVERMSRQVRRLLGADAEQHGDISGEVYDALYNCPTINALEIAEYLCADAERSAA